MPMAPWKRRRVDGDANQQLAGSDRTAAATQTRRATRQTSLAPPAVKPGDERSHEKLEPPKRKRGRPRRSPIDTEESAAVDDVATDPIQNGHDMDVKQAFRRPNGDVRGAASLRRVAFDPASLAPPSPGRDAENMHNGLVAPLQEPQPPYAAARLTRTTRFPFPDRSLASQMPPAKTAQPPRQHAVVNIGPLAPWPSSQSNIATRTVDPTAPPNGLQAPHPPSNGQAPYPPPSGFQAPRPTLSTNGTPTPAPATLAVAVVNAAATTSRQHQQQRQQLPYNHHSPQQQQQHQQTPQKLRPNALPTPEKRGFRTDRNVDKVVFGNACFSAWYPSYYGKEVLGDISGKTGPKTSRQPANGYAVSANNATQGPVIDAASNGKNGLGRGRAQARREREQRQPMLDRLYVCPSCFKYSKELLMWWEHVRVCDLRKNVPGRKIYVHPKGTRTVQVPAPPRSAKRKKGEAADKFMPQVVSDEGEWSVWEVDGEKDVLFCQNLSLFGKLFLDTKSVFFDVMTFNYFLLVYTPPALKKENIPDGGSGTSAAAEPPNPRIVGFFSKEKMSWDNNTLACIIVFPPWQRKGLGALLMGVSYEIARREGLLGGPEKPISELGRKGYKRYWASEIARWLMSLELTAANGSTATNGADGAIVDVEECSRAIWVAVDDCLATMREMNIFEDAGMGPPRRPSIGGVAAGRDGGGDHVQQDETGEAPANGDSEGRDADEGSVRQVKRVRVSKEALRRWVAANGANLTRPCDPDGFVDDAYARPPREVGDGTASV